MDTFKYTQVEKSSFSECLKNLGDPNAFVNIKQARTNENLLRFYIKILLPRAELVHKLEIAPPNQMIWVKHLMEISTCTQPVT